MLPTNRARHRSGGRAEFRPAKHSPKLFAKKRIDALIGAVRKWCKANSLSRDPGSCQLVGKPFEPARAQQRRRR
jgi:hypothetical protein